MWRKLLLLRPPCQGHCNFHVAKSCDQLSALSACLLPGLLVHSFLPLKLGRCGYTHIQNFVSLQSKCRPMMKTVLKPNYLAGEILKTYLRSKRLTFLKYRALFQINKKRSKPPERNRQRQECKIHSTNINEKIKLSLTSNK